MTVKTGTRGGAWFRHVAWIGGLALAATAAHGRPDCPNEAAAISGTVTRTQPLMVCQDNKPCGYIEDYTPPPGGAPCVPNPGTCCVPQIQHAYRRVYFCEFDQTTQKTRCVATAPIRQGPDVAVMVTAPCNPDGTCGDPPAFPFPPE